MHRPRFDALQQELGANARAGATVDLLLNVTGEPVELLNIFSFTLPGSIHDSWAAGVYPLSLLIALLSGLWPYVKLLLMLACWWA